jgi:hypothetical protein
MDTLDKKDMREILAIYSNIIYHTADLEMKRVDNEYFQVLHDPKSTLDQKSALAASSGLSYMDYDRAMGRYVIVSILKDYPSADLEFNSKIFSSESEKCLLSIEKTENQNNCSKKKLDSYLRKQKVCRHEKFSSARNKKKDILTCCICDQAQCTCPEFHF